jgi:serine/threonine protein kinase
MANKQDIITAIKNLDIFLKVPELKGATVKLNKNGSPFVYTGGFNMVFQLTKGIKKWAFRVWHVPMGETKKRYQSISKYLTQKNLPYFANFIFDEKGILVNGNLIDTIRMEWLDGDLFKKYIETNLNNKSSLDNLADNFVKMCQDLRDNKISHGDLQEGNILVTKSGEIKLVDYDSICIPEIEGQKELVTGLKGYQHPSRFKESKASLKADYFSELVIYISIKALAEKPELWGKYQIKDTQYLLFSETDFENLEYSDIYKDLKGINLKTDKLLSILIEYLKIDDYTKLNPFQSYLLPAEILLFKTDKDILIEGGEITLEWKVCNAIEVVINNGIGKVDFEDTITLKPKDNLNYILTANGFNENTKRTIAIKVYPLPTIKSMQIPIPIFEKTTNMNITLPQLPNIQLGINKIENSINVKIDSVDYIQEYSNKENLFGSLDNHFGFIQNTTGYLIKLFNKIRYENNKVLTNIFKSN